MAINPREKMMMDKTIAKIGRSIKNFEKSIDLSVPYFLRFLRGNGGTAGSFRSHRDLSGSDRRTWDVDLLQSADNHFVSWGKTGLNQALTVCHASSYDIFALRHITGANH